MTPSPEGNGLEKDVGNAVVFNREAFRKSFSGYYDKLEVDVKDTYTRLYAFYSNLTEVVRIEPAPKHPDELGGNITDEDLFNLEESLGMMFQIGVNHWSKQLDDSAGRPFIPRDVTSGDGSYLGTYSDLSPEQQKAVREKAKTTKPDPKAREEVMREIGGIVKKVYENR